MCAPAGFNGGDGNLNVGFLGVALALGLTVVLGAYALGPVSGGHFNPAVTLGLAVARRFVWGDVLGYLVAQFLGGISASALLFVILSGGENPDLTTQFTGASTGYGVLSPGVFTLLALIAIPVSNASFNPARSLATAVFGGPEALGQVWVTLLAPVIGAIIAGATFSLLFDRTVALTADAQRVSANA